MEVTYDYEGIKKNVTRARIEAGPSSLWRYKDFLPVDVRVALDVKALLTGLGIGVFTWPSRARTANGATGWRLWR